MTANTAPPLIGGDGPLQTPASKGKARHRLAVGRQRANAPRTAATRAIALAVRDVILPDLARDAIKPNVRQAFYILTTRDLVEKSKKGYGRWKDQSADMRKGGWIDLDAFLDGTHEPIGGDGDDGRPSALFRDIAADYRTSAWAGQPVVAELWCEAGTHYEMFAPLASELRVALVVTHGNPSISLLYDCAQAINARYQEGQTTRIIYAGDHDAAGVDTSRHLHKRLCEMHMVPEACTVERVAVTVEQITQRVPRLPTRPLKGNKRDKKEAWYEREFPGLGYVELDALPPRELLAIVRGAIADTIADPQAWAVCAAYEAAERRRLLAFIDRHQTEIDGLEDAERMWT